MGGKFGNQHNVKLATWFYYKSSDGGIQIFVTCSTLSSHSLELAEFNRNRLRTRRDSITSVNISLQSSVSLPPNLTLVVVQVEVIIDESSEELLREYNLCMTRGDPSLGTVKVDCEEVRACSF